MVQHEKILSILELAKWAPSGDNCQPWRFEILSETCFLVHLKFEPENIYEYNDGQPAIIAFGCLVENIVLASSTHGYIATLTKIFPRTGNHQTFEITLQKDETIQPNELAGWIKDRSVNRGPYKTGPIPPDVQKELESCMPENVQISWYWNLREKLRFIRMYMLGTDIRLSIPEAFKIHKDMLDWKNRYSPTGIPVGATGLSRMTIGLMRHVMKSFERLNFMNRFMWGTLAPRLELDLVPGLFCASHFTISFKKQKGEMDIGTLIGVGRSLQRFWLTATKNGLVMQPEFAPVIFSTYADKHIKFTSDSRALIKAEKLACLVRKVAPDGDIDRLLFIGRSGYPQSGHKNSPRSVRLPLDQLMGSINLLK